MRIALLEWICSSGLVEATQEDSALVGLADEGIGMVLAIAELCTKAGFQLSVPLAQSFATKFEEQAVHLVSMGCDLTVLPMCEEQQTSTRAWLDIAGECDLSIVIAPEIDRILQDVVEAFECQGLPTWNCSGVPLTLTCDKYETAQHLLKHGISHPPTTLLTELREPFLERTAAECMADSWIIKHRTGAGCVDLFVTSDPVLFSTSAYFTQRKHEFIVQPLVQGQNLTRSAIISGEGAWNWLPTMHQVVEESTLGDTPPASISTAIQNPIRTLRYQRSTVPAKSSGLKFPEQLEKTVQSAFSCNSEGLGSEGRVLGWFGTDWVLDQTDRWWLIECNPRFTTSVRYLDASTRQRVGTLLQRSIA